MNLNFSAPLYVLNPQAFDAAHGFYYLLPASLGIMLVNCLARLAGTANRPPEEHL
jgi:hypothetical protein